MNNTEHTYKSQVTRAALTRWRKRRFHLRLKKARAAIAAGPDAVAKFLEPSRKQRLKEVRKYLRRIRHG